MSASAESTSITLAAKMCNMRDNHYYLDNQLLGQETENRIKQLHISVKMASPYVYSKNPK